MTKKDTKQLSYMALAPLSSLAAVFINPLVCTIIPLILFFIFRNSRAKVAKVALQTADLAFSIQLWLVLISLALGLGNSLELITADDARYITFISTIVIMVMFVISLLFALYQALNNRTCKHLLSFKIAERVFGQVSSKQSGKEAKK